EAGAVHLAVVDPGVGSKRRAVAFRLRGSWYVGPDNGLFGLVLTEAEPDQPVGVELVRPPGASPTFEGRDVFAPAAAALAAGLPSEDLGRPLSRPLAKLAIDGPCVLLVVRLLNLTTNLTPPLYTLTVL